LPASPTYHQAGVFGLTQCSERNAEIIYLQQLLAVLNLFVVFEWPYLPTTLPLLRLCFFKRLYPPFPTKDVRTRIILRIYAALLVDAKGISDRGKYFGGFIPFLTLLHRNLPFFIRENIG